MPNIVLLSGYYLGLSGHEKFCGLPCNWSLSLKFSDHNIWYATIFNPAGLKINLFGH